MALEESISKYAEGIKRIEQCRAILESAEKKIQLLTKGDADSLTTAGQLEEPREGDQKP